MMGIVVLETYSAYKKYNKISSAISWFYSSVITSVVQKIGRRPITVCFQGWIELLTATYFRTVTRLKGLWRSGW